MNDQLLTDTINAALANIIDFAPGPAPWPLRLQTVERSSSRPRWMVPAAATAVGIAGVSAVVLVGGRGTDAPGTNAPATAAPTAPTSTPAAVVGEPTCGVELPVIVTVPGASGAIPGPAVDPAPAEGQYVAHWDGNFGLVEVRWPADSRILYDLTGEFADSDIGPRYVQLETAGDGSSIDASLDVASVWDGVPVSMAPTSVPMLHMERGPGEGDYAAPCDVVQVRYVGDEGWHFIHSYFIPDFSSTYGGGDLHPLIVSTEASTSPPTADDVTPCDPERGVRGGTTMGNPVSPTPAEALEAYLADPQADGDMDSGYNEYVADEGDLYVYTYRADYDPTMIATLVTVERDGDGWSVTALYHSGC